MSEGGHEMTAGENAYVKLDALTAREAGQVFGDIVWSVWKRNGDHTADELRAYDKFMRERFKDDYLRARSIRIGMPQHVALRMVAELEPQVRLATMIANPGTIVPQG
jgi:hypothetical protein